MTKGKGCIFVLLAAVAMAALLAACGEQGESIGESSNDINKIELESMAEKGEEPADDSSATETQGGVL